MKKKIIAIILLILALILIGLGVYFGLSMVKDKVAPKTTDSDSDAEIKDIFSVHTMDELKEQTEKDKLSFDTTEEDSIVFVYGYKFNGRETPVTVYKDKEQKITKMAIETFPFLTVSDIKVSTPVLGNEVVNQDSGLDAKTLKVKCEEAMNIIAKRFKTTVDGNYKVFDTESGKELDKNNADVFDKIVNRKAFLTFSVKTKDGEIWELFVENQEFYGGILFRVTRNVDTQELKGFVTNIDLSAQEEKVNK